MEEQNVENIRVIGSNPVLGESFYFEEDRKRVALMIHVKIKHWVLFVQVRIVLELANVTRRIKFCTVNWWFGIVLGY